MQWNPYEDKAICTICEEKSDEGFYRCTGESNNSRTGMRLTDVKVAVHTRTADAWVPCVLFAQLLSDLIKYARLL